MKVTDFRITNFKSIVDTGWRSFSHDNVTVFVGQNESGKSSILEALSKTLSYEALVSDDTRTEDPLPIVYLRFELSDKDIEGIEAETKQYEQYSLEVARKYIQKNNKVVDLAFSWNSDDLKPNEYVGQLSIADSDELDAMFSEAIMKREQLITSELGQIPNAEAPSLPKIEYFDSNELASEIFKLAPRITFFDDSTGLLPKEIDIVDGANGQKTLEGSGKQAAANFLTVAGLKIRDLVDKDDRTRRTILKKANDAISKEFTSFWTQTIGQSSKLRLELSYETYGVSVPEKTGKNYLSFWVFDGEKILSPSQRSKGVRWYISFYLQLRASEKRATKRIFLFDEPGANLHSMAQADVLKLINKLSKDIQIIYSTHSPHMIEYDKLYRVLAVQRLGKPEDDNSTEIITAHQLGTASRDTLSPILTAMGTDFSQQQVIKKKNNVILEEMSGYYYMKAFWELLNEKQEANFIAASGVNNVESLANMFTGWGLEFIIAVDDDGNGRGVYNTLKRYFYGDSDDFAKQFIYKIKDKNGIEDIFTNADFKKYVLCDDKLTFDNANSSYLNATHLSKHVLSFQFLLKVRAKEILLKNLSDDTVKNIRGLVKDIVVLLKNYSGDPTIPK